MKPRKSFLLRLNSELYEALQAWASQELRSTNGQIEYVLKEALRQRGHRVDEAGEEETTPPEPSPR